MSARRTTKPMGTASTTPPRVRTEEQKEQKRLYDQQRRRDQRVSESLRLDEIASLSAKNDRLTKRLSGVMQPAPEIDDVECESPAPVPLPEPQGAAHSSGTESDDGADGEHEINDVTYVGPPLKETDATTVLAKLQHARLSDKRMRRWTGLTVAVFDSQVAAFTPFLHTTTNVGKQASQKLRPDAWVVPTDAQFFVAFCWLRTYLTQWLMADVFGLGFRIVAKVLKRVCSAVERAVDSGKLTSQQGGVAFPSAAELDALDRFNPYKWDGLKRAIAVDGMHMVCYARRLPNEATDKAAHDKAVRELKQPKHACYGTLALIACDLTGRIIWYTPPCAGHEQSLLKESTLRALAKQIDAVIVSDAGLHMNSKKEDPKTWCRTSQSVGPGMIRLMSLVNKNEPHFKGDVEKTKWCKQVYYTAKHVSQMRIVVENVIAQLRHWHAASDPWRGHFQFDSGLIDDVQRRDTYCVSQTTAFKCVVALQNAMRHVKPLRHAAWTPDISGFPEGFKPGYPVNPATKAQFANVKGLTEDATKVLEVGRGVKKAYKDLKKALERRQKRYGGAKVVLDDEPTESEYDEGAGSDAMPVECSDDKDFVVYRKNLKQRVDPDVAAGLKPSRYHTKKHAAAQLERERAARDAKAAQLEQQSKEAKRAPKKRSVDESPVVEPAKKKKARKSKNRKVQSEDES